MVNIFLPPVLSILTLYLFNFYDKKLVLTQKQNSNNQRENNILLLKLLYNHIREF